LKMSQSLESSSSRHRGRGVGVQPAASQYAAYLDDGGGRAAAERGQRSIERVDPLSDTALGIGVLRVKGQQ
jgi:hypothetical protein